MPDKPRLARTGPAPKIGIVHLGPGAFFRAFGAVYTHEAMEAAGGDWGILAVSLRSPTARDQLAPQGGLYTSVTLSPSGRKPQVIGSIAEVLVAATSEDREQVIARTAEPGVRIISLTITEKGYGYDPSTGGLDRSHPDIASDLENPSQPRSAIGILTATLERRQRSGTGPVAILSCDNLPSNGKVTRAVLLEFAQAANMPDLAAWITESVSFPSTMVDRITPATTPHDVTWMAENAGYSDLGLVVHEPFRQWVIEDDFPAGRPAWDQVGARMVKDVEAHEAMKLRCLNGTHSTLAYLGYLAGHETIAEAVADPPFANLCTRLWQDEILPTVAQPEGEDLPAYCTALLQRYRNPAIRHRTWQIAMDGSQKLPQRLLGTIRDNLAHGRTPNGLCLAVAGWMRYVGGMDETGSPIDVRDPMADALRAASDSATAPADKVAAFLAIDAIFEPGLAANPEFRAAVTNAFERLTKDGARRTVEAYKA